MSEEKKPFDVVDLENKLKAAGLPAVENLAKIAAEEVFDWLKESLSLEAQSNPLFAIGVPLLSAIEPLVMAEIGKISPVVPSGK